MNKIFQSFVFVVMYLMVGFPVALLIRLIKPFRIIRFGRLFSSRIGHFAANTELYLCERDAGMHAKTIDFWYLDGLVSNQALAQMWSERLKILPRWIMLPLVHANRSLPFKSDHKAPEPYQFDRDVLNLYKTYPPHLCFNKSQEAEGRSFLYECGLNPNDRFVCVTVRDSAYLKKNFPSDNFSYHDYRDSSLENYFSSMLYLAEQGFYVFRMGAVVEKELGIVHPRIFDYASNGMRSEFLDIYLAANCEFCVTCGTGFDALPVIFRKPLLQVNAVPVGYMYSFLQDSLLMAKHHLDKNTMRELTIEEIFARGAGFCLRSSCFDDAGIMLKENSSEEILEATKQMVRDMDSPDDLVDRYDRKLWDLYPVAASETANGRPLHGEINARFSEVYFNQQYNLISQQFAAMVGNAP